MKVFNNWSLWLFISWFSIVQAETGEPYTHTRDPKIALNACNALISSSATFCKAAARRRRDYSCVCKNTNALATFSGCYHMLGKDTPKYVNYFLKQCELYNVTLSPIDFEDAYKNYTSLSKFPHEIEGFNKTKPIDVPIALTQNATDIYWKSYKQFNGNYEDSLYYGAGVLGYWLLVFVLAAISNWGKFLFPSVFKFFTGPVSNIWRKHVTLPATSRKKKSNEQRFLFIFDLLIPSRLETLILVGFLFVLIACLGANMTYHEGDPIFTNRREAMLRYLADRTGIVTTVLMPLLILFAGRNNFLQWFTLWNYATFIAFHRWVARAVFSMVVVHAVCFTIYEGSRYSHAVQQTYFKWGIIATVAGGIIMFQGMLFLRRRWYEMFLLIHIIMAALFIGGAWIHTDELGYVWFYYATSAVWVFDRAVRLGRIFSFGFPDARVFLLADETLKVKVPKPKYWKSIPGGHAFIHFLRPSCFWQSHPFTFIDSIEDENTITLYCKVKGGVTHGLYQYLATHPGRSTHIKVALEGPYGAPSPVSRYDTSVFIAGGNGIPGIYSEIHNLATRSKDNIKQSLKLYWIVRDYKSLYWFYEELLALKNSKIQTTIYITKPDTGDCLEEFNLRFPLGHREELDLEEEKELKLNNKHISLRSVTSSYDNYSANRRIVSIIQEELSHVSFKEGRPCIEKIVTEDTRESQGSTAFTVCGHPIMVDDLRKAIVRNLGHTDGKRVDFFEELQVWA
ncbi:ferric reductase transmembrane component [Suhomyces tanzawaensis NRRL Y-17324]|uniref:ferric-chelate reductase (NADPH) n=1 Tax=Suhomyces tanzawaensis NRRL Y-17324 TaxID=984487 RepID=A0A1E4SEY2_9ASCO|nr:ferric reductase transmembrane component [Suhomyces tanzawaensis NRRL Y-17324]ODV78043.1 ferric reductase transmembrane component [Suhomyces tanzawaensis NRRL Y-17324]